MNAHLPFGPGAPAADQPPDLQRELDDAQRGMRDLMGLLALSALWLGRDGATVLQLMAQAVERLVPMRFSFIEAGILAGDTPRRFVRVDGAEPPAEDLDAWQEAARDWPKLANLHYATSESRPTPIGPMRVVRLELGVSQLGGGAWFGADTPGFPSSVELAILRAAASLAATGLQAARLKHAQDEAARQKDEFLAMLGHELRNPLAPIRASAALWKADNVNPERMRRTGAIVERQVRHMTHLVDDLLDVSRLTTGNIPIEMTPMDLRGAIRVALEQTRSQIEVRQHQLDLDLPETPLPVQGDEKRLIQVLSNLLNNAARYTPAGGHIALAAEIRARTVRVRITDNGIGIEPRMLARVFELFAQVKRSSDRVDGGLGVGLSLARKLAHLHGGELEAYSEGLGKGATLTLILPLAALPAAAPAEAPVEAAPCARKVLVVDDNEDAGTTMALLLDALGHEARVVHHPQAALDLAPVFAPDVFLLDIGLPGIDGYELARRLRALPGMAGVQLIALTGFGQAHDQRSAFDAGFDFHCTKPVDIGVLTAIFAQIGASEADT